MGSRGDALHSGRSAYESGDWADAFTMLTVADMPSHSVQTICNADAAAALMRRAMAERVEPCGRARAWRRSKTSSTRHWVTPVSR